MRKTVFPATEAQGELGYCASLYSIHLLFQLPNSNVHNPVFVIPSETGGPLKLQSCDVVVLHSQNFYVSSGFFLGFCFLYFFLFHMPQESVSVLVSHHRTEHSVWQGPYTRLPHRPQSRLSKVANQSHQRLNSQEMSFVHCTLFGKFESALKNWKILLKSEFCLFLKNQNWHHWAHNLKFCPST